VSTTTVHMLIYQDDLPASAQSLLLWQHSCKERLKAYACALGSAAQISEALLFGILIGTSFDAATGEQLDRWGLLVGEERGGLTDTEFRLLIDLRVFVNTAHPSEDNMYSLISRGLAPSAVRADYMRPGGIQYHVASLVFTPEPFPTRIGQLVRSFKPVGVATAIVEYVPDHFALDWETVVPLITNGTGTAVLSKLLHDGR